MTRQNFYQGQSVAPEHLNKLQTYAEQGQADLIASLLGYGIVNGFEVSTIEGHIVGVTAGLAFNLAGERLVLAEGQQVNLAQYIPNVGDKIVKLGIIRNFIKTDPVTDSMGNVEQTTWTPTVQFITGESLDSGVFELAEIKINPLSVVEIKATEAHFTTLQKQIQHTSALKTTEEGATLQGNILSLLAGDKIDLTTALMSLTANNSTSIESPLINLITQNLQINGTPYMEIGSNDNGHYVKFESGLLVCFQIKHKSGTPRLDIPSTWYINNILPIQFISNEYATIPINDYTMGRSDRMTQYHTKYRTTSSFNFEVDCCTHMQFGGYLAIGFWK